MPRRNINPWDLAKSLPVIRGNPMYKPAPLEDGVKFFVLMLERLGCETIFSCEGHPDGFYVVFRGDIATAREIARCGFFGVEVGREDDTYRMGLRCNEACSRKYFDEPFCEDIRVRCLRHAATAWVERFGELMPFVEVRQVRKTRRVRATK
jgi:hypothetical protein